MLKESVEFSTKLIFRSAVVLRCNKLLCAHGRYISPGVGYARAHIIVYDVGKGQSKKSASALKLYITIRALWNLNAREIIKFNRR